MDELENKGQEEAAHEESDQKNKAGPVGDSVIDLEVRTPLMMSTWSRPPIVLVYLVLSIALDFLFTHKAISICDNI